MEICVESFDGEKYTVEVGVDDTTADIRRKVASAAELREDGFDISFGGKVMVEGDNTTQLSAGDTVVLTKTLSQKDGAIAALRALGETTLTAERFKGLEDPKLVHLFLQAEVVTKIPFDFLRESTLEELDLNTVPVVTTICEGFLYDCTALRASNLSGWTSVSVIQSSFICGCRVLTALDLSGWSSVREIGHSFLNNCRALTTLDMSGWHSVVSIKDYFLALCSSLTTLHLAGWSNVTDIEYGFLWGCTALTEVDLSGWASVEATGRGCFKKCKLRAISINVDGSSAVLSENIFKKDDVRCQCVCL